MRIAVKKKKEKHCEFVTSLNSLPQNSFILKQQTNLRIITHSPATTSLTAVGASMRLPHPAAATHSHHHL